MYLCNNKCIYVITNVFMYKYNITISYIIFENEC